MTFPPRLLLLSLAALAAGCGSGAHRATPPAPKLPQAVARQLASLSGQVAQRLDAGDPCGALQSARALQQETIAAVNTHRVPAALQEPLTSATAELVLRIPCVPPARPVPPDEHGKHDDHGKHKGGGGD